MRLTRLCASLIVPAAAALVSLPGVQRDRFDRFHPLLSGTDSSVGLLNGIDVMSAKYYTSDLKMDSLDDVQWLKDPGVAWEAAIADAS